MNPMLIQLKSRLAPSMNDIEQTTIADASVLIAITDELNPKVMLTRRANHMNTHAGEVSFPGGRYEVQDKSNVQTALRESYEETNLSQEVVQVIGQLPIQTSKSGLSVRPIIGMIPPNQSYIPEAKEISRIFWAELEWLIDTETTEYQVSYTTGGIEYSFITPRWVVEDEIVWGLTGKIIANLLEIGFDRQIEWYYRVIT